MVSAADYSSRCLFKTDPDTLFHRFMFLGSRFNYSSKILSLAIKVVVNQVLFSPVLNVYFFGMQAVLSGDDTRGVVQRIRGAVPESIVNSLKFWPAVTALTFAFIQPQYRFLFSGGFATLWQTYLSYLNRREEVRTRVAAEELAVEHEAQIS
jgi:protein Mpv17